MKKGTNHKQINQPGLSNLFEIDDKTDDSVVTKYDWITDTFVTEGKTKRVWFPVQK